MAAKEVPAMFRHKTPKVYPVLTKAELRLAVEAMIRFRNKVIAENGPTEDIDALLLKLMGKRGK